MFYCMYYRRGPHIYNKTYNKIPRGGVQYNDEREKHGANQLVKLILH